QEVKSLLTSHRNVGSFLESPAIKVAAQTMARAEAREAGDSVLGQIISHYRILRRLGSGGMGVVYEAEDIRLGRRVALKFLPESLAHDKRTLRRFEREARVASSLNHPNICTIYEVEEHDHQPVIVMELLEGESLKHRILEGPISTNELLDFGIQTSDALEAAHAKGIIHRDLKPGLRSHAVLNAQPAAARKPNPSRPAALDTIIARALEKDRDKRFQHAADICSDLKRLKRETQKAPMTVAIAAPRRPTPRSAGY